jgi:hypothetical protein
MLRYEQKALEKSYFHFGGYELGERHVEDDGEEGVTCPEWRGCEGDERDGRGSVVGRVIEIPNNDLKAKLVSTAV